MFGKSIRFQFSAIGILYLMFALLVIVEMFYVYRREQTDIVELRRTNDTTSEYLKLEDDEIQLVQRIRTFIANGVTRANADKLNTLDEDIGKWFAKIEFWKQKMASWKISADAGSLENSVFSKTFMYNKKRQANAYKHAIQCCRENKMLEAQHVLNIEARFSHSVHDTIELINAKVELRMENSLKTLRTFFMIMTVGCLFALALLAIVGTGVYRSIIGSINKIDLATKRISSGNFSSGVKILSPKELAFLASSFNTMQNTIKLRDAKIHEDAEDIKKINEFLEQKVISCNRSIDQQEDALTRKNDEIDQTLRMMSDELDKRIKEVNTASKTLFELEDNPLTDDARIVEQLQKLIRGMKRLHSMSNQLTTLAGVGTEIMHIQHLPMGAVLKNITEHLKFHLGMAGAELVLGDNIIDCQGDGSMLEQAFIKIVENSIRFRSPDRPCHIEISSEMDILFVRYKISDNGVGIPKESREKIFQAFYQLNGKKSEGEGLGLAIVHRVIDLHNGRIWIEDGPNGVGTTVVIELPKQQQKH